MIGAIIMYLLGIIYIKAVTSLAGKKEHSTVKALTWPLFAILFGINAMIVARDTRRAVAALQQAALQEMDAIDGEFI